MTPNNWERLKPLFEQALSLPPEARDAFLDKIRLQDQDLARDLTSLLREGQTGPLDKPLGDLHETPMSSRRGETAPLTPSRDGQVIAGRFRIIRCVGKGGMGEVFEAYDLKLKDRVALKMIRPDLAAKPNVAERFKREILLGQQIGHPNVCRIHDLHFEQAEDGSEILFFTMKFLDGETLASRIKRGPMNAAEALPLIKNMADGLAAAHDVGIIHRDFKSGNVMLDNSSGLTCAVITDFGLARALRESEERSAITKPGTIAGTVDYMAPEQILGEKLTPAADIYSLGVVMYEMATGTLPFKGDTDTSVALKHLNEQPPFPRKIAPDLDANWETAILGCLCKTPKERFDSAVALKSALVSSSDRPLVRPRAIRRLLTAICLSVLFAILVGISAWAYRERHSGLMNSQQRVAVLEFENVGGDPNNRAFCEGLMETLSSKLTELEQFQGKLSVVPASEVRKDKVTSAREAQRDFGVTLVVTGSVQRLPNGMRLTFNLVDARQLKQLRSHAMFIPESDALSMQKGVITQVTDLLDIQLRPEAQRRLSEGNTPVPGAYDFYLQGSGYLLVNQFGADQAIAEFQHALDRDPNYALAYAGLGRAYWAKYQSTKDRSWIDRAWRACSRSIELNPQLPDAHITLALLNSGTGHYDEAIRQARQAIRIDPYDDRAYSELARALDAMGKTDEAEATMNKALSLRPGSWSNYVRLGNFYAKHNKYSEAEKAFLRVIELVPDNPIGYTNLGSLYYVQGRYKDAEDKLKKSIDTKPTPTARSNLATIYFYERRYADALPIMEKLVADGAREYMIWGNLGDAYRWTPGNQEKAGPAYQKALVLVAEVIDVNHHDPVALSSAALYRAKLGQTTRALQEMEEALKAAPNDKSVLFNAAVTSELVGERGQALKFARRAILGGYSPNEIATEPELGKLRQDPSYQAAVSLNPGR